ncbi:hypothetical protein IV203_019349 [Nitzschia inconspicua]|uniref:Uncharacterized protein n=1 Tax=Nitzschia inconspicua TaxID=303405 RepID=A0A9K3LZ18_9STRA|nr:hypothetical protein IV203_019349 [Nitzschia inconspicua]
MDDGWDDDDDIDLDLTTIQEDATDENPLPQQIYKTDMVTAVADGWDDFGDNIDDKDNSQEENIGFPEAAPVTVPEPSPPNAQLPGSPADKEGWDEDEEDLNFDDDGWGADDTAAIDEGIEEVASQTLPDFPTSIQPPSLPQDNYLFQELDNYVRSLDRMASSINAILEFEYNTTEKAQELEDYYASRPQLAEYTISKELQRMNYQVVLPHGHVETDKKQIIEQNLLPEELLVSRAANQSLLADLLHVITGPDLIVRPQYLATCVAHWCQFTVHIGDGQDLVQCQAKLRLSLPTVEQGDRLDIAEVGVAVVFAPSQPMVEYKVHRIDVLLQDPSQLQGSVQFLAAMEGHWDEMPEIAENQRLQNAPADIFRDQFLVNSQRFLSQSTQGMKSALDQVDSVINVRGKLQAISNFIPATDTLLEAEREAMELAEARQREMMQRQQQQQQPANAFFPRPHQESQGRPMQVEAANRPKSILGSLIGAVAQSVALHEEDEAVIYGAVAPQQRPAHFQRNDAKIHYDMSSTSETAFPKLYKEEGRPNEVEETVPPPTLYRKEESHRKQPLNEDKPFRPYEEEPQLPVATMPFEPLHDDYFQQEEEVVADGWDDDDPLENIIEGEGEVNTETALLTTQQSNTNNDQGKGDTRSEDGWHDVDAADVVVDTYDADIIPTRKRWLNPRPNRPYLYGLGY